MTSSSSYQCARVLAGIAQDIAAHSDPAPAIDLMLELARLTTGATSAGMWVRTPLGTAKLRASTDPALSAYVDRLLVAQRPGTVVECIERAAVVSVADAQQSYRWRLEGIGPDVRDLGGDVAVPLTPRSVAAFSLTVDAQHLGMLVLASAEPGLFTEEVLEVGALFAQHAALGLEVVNRVCKTRNLEGALESNRRIGVAIGVLMSRHRITEETAFALLRKDSQSQHRKLREVADEVILMGDLPSALPSSLAS